MHNVHYELFYTLHYTFNTVRILNYPILLPWLLDSGRYHDLTSEFLCFLKLHYPYSVATAMEITSLFPMDTSETKSLYYEGTVEGIIHGNQTQSQYNDEV